VFFEQSYVLRAKESHFKAMAKKKKTTDSLPACPPLTETLTVTRTDALAYLMQCLRHPERLKPETCQKVSRLIILFNLGPEDLLEAGLPYETLCAVERQFFPGAKP
jgi:hypothetical protein